MTGWKVQWRQLSPSILLSSFSNVKIEFRTPKMIPMMEPHHDIVNSLAEVRSSSTSSKTDELNVDGLKELNLKALAIIAQSGVSNK
jgi:hypothetical protein